MVVAAAALQRQPEHGRAEGVHAVSHVLDPPFLDDRAAFVVEAMDAIERGGEPLIGGGVRQQIARELLDGETGRTAGCR